MLQKFSKQFQGLPFGAGGTTRHERNMELMPTADFIRARTPQFMSRSCFQTLPSIRIGD
jgi:hypothetical protein